MHVSPRGAHCFSCCWQPPRVHISPCGRHGSAGCCQLSRVHGEPCGGLPLCGLLPPRLRCSAWGGRCSAHFSPPPRVHGSPCRCRWPTHSRPSRVHGSPCAGHFSSTVHGSPGGVQCSSGCSPHPRVQHCPWVLQWSLHPVSFWAVLHVVKFASVQIAPAPRDYRRSRCSRSHGLRRAVRPAHVAFVACCSGPRLHGCFRGCHVPRLRGCHVPRLRGCHHIPGVWPAASRREA